MDIQNNKKWSVCILCTLLVFGSGGLTMTAFSIHQPYLVSIAHFTNTQSSLIISVRTVANLAAVLWAYKIYERFSVRSCLFVSSLSAFASFFLYGIAGNITGLYFTAAFLGGIAAGLGGIVPATILMSRWFVKNVSLAIGICAAGTGISAMIAPLIIEKVINDFSWQTAFLAEAFFCAVVGVLVFMFVQDYPDEQSREQDRSKKNVQPNLEKSLLNKKKFLVMCLAIFMQGVIGNVSYPHLSVLLSSEQYTTAAISVILSAVGVTLTIGKCLYGWVTDKIGVIYSNVIFCFFLIVGELLCCFTPVHNRIITFLCIVCLGSGLSLCTVGVSVYALQLGGHEYSSVLLRSFQVVYQGGALIFSSLPGMIADMSGSYIPFYLLMVIFTLFSGILVQSCLLSRNLINAARNNLKE